MWILAVVDLVVLVALIARHAMAAQRFPEPTPRPFRCAVCSRGYQNSRLLAMHHIGQHEWENVE